MIDDQLSPEERQLVQQIQSVPKPKLDAVARETIRQDMLTEFRGVMFPAQPHSHGMRPRFSFQTTYIRVAAAVVVVLVAGLFLLQNGTRNHPGSDSVLTASPANQIAVVPTQTSTSPVVAATPTVSTTASPVASPESTPSLTVTLLPAVSTQTRAVSTQTPADSIQTPTQSVVVVTSTDFMTASPVVSPELTPGLTATLPLTVEVTPAPSSTPVSLPTPTEERIITIEGPVTSIVDDEVTIYGFPIEVAPQHPILQIIDVGDVVRVQGVLDSGGTVLAEVVSNIPDAAAAANAVVTVGLDGPVEAINGNMLVVNGISIELAPDDPLLQTVQPGNFVSVEGNFQTNGSAIVLVAVNIVVINTTTIQSDCQYHVDAMGMGHWHCDGMGMGMGMGMGDAMGMGMGMGMEG